MSKKKRYEYVEHNSYEDKFDRRAKKKAARLGEERDDWKFSVKDYDFNEDDDYEDWQDEG